MKKNLPFLLVFLFVGITSIHSQSYTSVATYAGTGVAGHVDNPIASAEFTSPYGVCIDPATGDMYVADPGNQCIRKISGGVVTTLAGSGTQGDVDGQGTGASFYGPSGVTFSNGYLYITDNGNHKIKKIDAAGNVTTIAGTGLAGLVNGNALQARFNNPTDLVVDPNGDVYVTDYGNNCIRKISGGQVTTYAGNGTAGDILGTASSAEFNRPRSLCMDPSGNIFVCDMVNNKIKEITSLGMVNLIAGSGVQGSQDGTGSGATFYHPTGIDFDMYWNLVIVDAGNNKVRRITQAGVTTTIAGTGAAGFNNGPDASATFNDPEGMCVSPTTGVIYVGDKLNNVIRALGASDDGVSEISFEQTLSLFPNPSNDKFTISNSNEQKIKTISIYDAQGKLCKSITVEGEPAEIVVSIADLSPAQYFIVAEGDKIKLSGKIIKQ